MFFDFVLFSDRLTLKEKEVVYFFVELTEAFKVFGVFDFMTGDLVCVFSRSDGFVLSLHLLADLCFKEFGIVVLIRSGVLICREIIFISSDSFERIFFTAASFSSLISDSESLSSR